MGRVLRTPQDVALRRNRHIRRGGDVLCCRTMQPNGDKSPIDPRFTVPEAAEVLGISPEAVRARIHRGTLRKEKAPDGTVYVRLNDDQSRSNGDDTPDLST